MSSGYSEWLIYGKLDGLFVGILIGPEDVIVLVSTVGY